ncbi:hypothetical protein ACFVFS_14180 [Kitasatospora sp. NPDC057692]|uniref:hypothetical protein n=1 Tax=Kitasatospora sp. NPDC057692 TaxID=3346215 RepID=UPI003692A5DA
MTVAILIPSVRPCDPPRQREQQAIRHRIGEVGERRDAGHGGEVNTDLVCVGLILAQVRLGVVQREAPSGRHDRTNLTEHGPRRTQKIQTADQHTRIRYRELLVTSP